MTKDNQEAQPALELFAALTLKPACATTEVDILSTPAAKQMQVQADTKGMEVHIQMWIPTKATICATTHKSIQYNIFNSLEF